MAVILLITCSCTKESITGANPDIQQKEVSGPEEYDIPIPFNFDIGEVFHADDWIGYIDPVLVGPEEPTEVYKTKPFKLGEQIEVDGSTAIICPEAGDNCGLIYTVDTRGVTYIGMYLN